LNTNKVIEGAIETKSSLKVIYHGGSMKGQLRDITPLSLKGDNIRARCHITNVVKTFKVPKMEVMDQEGVLTEATDKSESNIPNLTTLKELFDYVEYDSNFSEWHVVFEKQSISLHRKFKNGKPLKSSPLSICYDEFGFDSIHEMDGSETLQIYEKSKPWSFQSELGSSNFKHVDRAIEKFLKHAQIISAKRS
jgi:hypothetical protein